MRFYLQVIDGRMLIADRDMVRDDERCDILVTSEEADCWIAAKKAFGYPLSAVQDWLLGEFYRKREEALRNAA